jgi:hypothetical protein
MRGDASEAGPAAENGQGARRDEQISSAIDAQLRAIYSALPVGVAFVTPDLRYERVNTALARMNGRPVEAHLGRTVSEVLGEQARPVEELAREAIRRAAPVEAEFVRPAPEAPHEERYFEATYFPVLAPAEGETGELLGVGAVVRDVTQRRLQDFDREQLLRDALIARAQAEAAHVRAEAARHETEAALAEAEAQRSAAELARRRTAVLATVTHRMAASLDYEETLREVVSSAVPFLADWGLVSVLEPGGRLRLLGFAHRDPERERLVSEFAARYEPGGRSSLLQAIKTGRPVLATEVEPEQLESLSGDPDSLALALRLGVCQYGTWPIPSPDGRVIGTLSLVIGDAARRFSDDDLLVAGTVATRAGLHLTNARLYTERSEIARTLQASLMPRELPAVPGLEIASAFVAAGRENAVGGDFYDVFASGEGVWTAILGDVTGKGAGAAAVTATARHTLRAAALLDDRPASNLRLLNRVLVSDSGARAFCTIVYARLCPGPGGLTIRLVHAGHPPALVLRGSGQVETITGGRGPLVGVFPDPEFPEAKLELSAGSVLLLYTDGVTEARPSDVRLGEASLVSTLESMWGRPAREVAEAVRDGALELQEGVARDDLAVLAVRVL